MADLLLHYYCSFSHGNKSSVSIGVPCSVVWSRSVGAPRCLQVADTSALILFFLMLDLFNYPYRVFPQPNHPNGFVCKYT